MAQRVRGILDNLVWLQTACTQNGSKLGDEQLRLFALFAERLLEWNKKINVISRRDEENLWMRHILHSISILFKIAIPPGVKMLDLGCGGGLPGIPLKILRPDLTLTLLDSTQKKVNVVKHIINSLGLAGVDAVWGRAEDLGKQKDHTKQYDVVVARAVASLKDLVRWSAPFLKKGSTTREGRNPGPGEHPGKLIGGPALIAFKGGDIESEISQARNQPGIEAISILDLGLKGSIQLDDSDKKVIVVEYART